MNEYSFIMPKERDACKKILRIVLDYLENGGEDRTRTCKRLRAVVFKTTALPIRLPLHLDQTPILRDEKEIYRKVAAETNHFVEQKKPGCTPTAGLKE